VSTSKLTIVAQLRDELSAPLKKVIKGLDDAADAAAKGAVSADRQADAFNRLAKEAGWATNKAGKWVDESNRLVSKADRARVGIDALSLATHEAADATRRQEAAFKAVVHEAGYKIASDGSVRNALGLFVKQQDVAIMRTQAAARVTRAATASSKDYGEEAVRQARHTRLMNEAFELTVKSLGYTYNSQGKLVNVMGRVVAATEIAEHRADANRWATHRMGQTAEQAAKEFGRAGEQVDKFSVRAFNAGASVERLARTFGMSKEDARGLGAAFGNALDSGQISAGATAFKKKLDGIHDHAKGVAAKIESTMGKALKVGGLAGLGAAGYAAVGGMERLNALEQADVKLEVQDFTKEQREGIKNEVDQLVRGTFLTLPQALDTAQGLLGSGVELGPEFTEYMGTMVDAQSIYSSHDPKQLELVMRQIESKEILTGEERNQLAELGMPVNEWIAKEMGIEQNEVMDKIEAKEVTSDIWWKAMGKGVEGGAELMGKTFTGAWLNFLAAVKRSGQYFDEPLLEPMREGLNVMTKILDDNQQFFRDLGKAASVGMSEAADTIPQVLAALAPLGPSLIRLVDAISPLLPQLVQGFANWMQVMTPLLILVIEFLTVILELVGPALPVLIPLLFGVLTVLKAYGVLRSVIENWDKWSKLIGKTGPLLNIARVGIGLLGRAIMMFPGTWFVMAILAIVGIFGKLYDESEKVRDVFDWLSDAFRNADEWLNNFGASIDNFFEKHFPQLAKINDVLGAPLNWVNDKLSQLGNTAGKESGLHEATGGGEWFGSGEGALRFLHGSGSLDENGDPVGRGVAENRRREAAIPMIEYLPEAGMSSMEQLDAHLNPLPGPAEQATDRLADRVEPEHHVNDTEDVARMLPGPADQSVPGLADGGFTSNGEIRVGERGREFITSAWATNQVETNAPGAMQYINDTGQLPPTGGITINAPVTINGGDDPEMIRAIVMAAIQDAAREASREYMNVSVRGAG
jgi:hypothetical protein